MWGWHHDDWDGHMDGPWEWLGAGMMVLWSLLLVAAIIALVAWLVRSGREGGAGASGSQEPRGDRTAMSILEQRFARGEIDEEQFERMRRTLSGG